MRLILNFLITTALLLVLNAMGWLTLAHDGNPINFHELTWPVFGSVLLVAVVMWLTSILAGLLYVFGAIVTLGLALLLYPFVGWVALKLTEHFMPDTLVLHGFWITALCGFILLFAKLPSRSTSDA